MSIFAFISSAAFPNTSYNSTIFFNPSLIKTIWESYKVLFENGSFNNSSDFLKLANDSPGFPNINSTYALLLQAKANLGSAAIQFIYASSASLYLFYIL